MEPKRIDHRAAARLLPWLGQDRLDGPELEQLLDHLKVCRVCRAELPRLADLNHAVQLLGDAEALEKKEAARLPRLMARIERYEVERGRSLGRNHFESWRRKGRRLEWRHFLIGAQTAALLVLALFLWRSSPTPTFETLSNAPVSGSMASGSWRLVFAPELREAEARTLLIENEFEIVAGPTQRGVYTVRPRAGGSSRVGTLAQDPRLAFFEKVVTAEGP